MIDAHKDTRVLGVPPLSWNVVEQKARALMLRICPECLKCPTPTPVASLFEGGLQRELQITYGVENLLGAEAHFDPETGELILDESTYIGLLDDEGRDRFTVAHEIGHVVLHRPYYKSISRRRRQAILLNRSQVKPYQHPEKQSDVFASEFLIPTHHASQLILEGATVQDFSRIFLVSWDAARVKMERVAKQMQTKRPY